MENRVIKTIKERVSCRAYSDKKVSLKKALEIAEAGKFAPSGKNRQIANIFVVNSKKYVERLRKLSVEQLNRDCMYGAKTILIVTGPREDAFTFQDCSCILENMFVAASALKIATCWINQFDELFKNFLNERMKYIEKMAKYNIYPCETSEEALKLVERNNIIK